jgi:alkylation response protein AidB-like acyl-CoA dehydrogenase
MSSARALAYVAAASDTDAPCSPPTGPHPGTQPGDGYEYLVPVVKGFRPDVDRDSQLGVQVHGGVGYIEETGAASACDARILSDLRSATAIRPTTSIWGARRCATRA